MATKASWDDLIKVVRGIVDRDNGPPVKGKFVIADEDALEALRTCISSESETHLRLRNDEDPRVFKVGQTVEIEVAPRFGFGLLTADLGTLLHAQYAKVREPSNFFLLNEGISKTDEVPDDHLLSRYRAVLAFIQTLKRSAAFLDQDEPMLVFIDKGKFEVSIEYGAEDLRSLSLTAIRDCASVLPDGTHEKQCSSILAEAVVALTGHLASHERFKFLLTNSAELKKKFAQGYELFAAGFSYEKIRDEIEAARVEYAGKIHKIFSDIQNQLLGIPVAMIVVATQMKEHKVVDGNFWISSAVLVGSFIFMLLMHFLLRNQRHTLEVVGVEIKRQKGKLEKEHAAIASNFSETFASLDKRYRAQRRVLRAIDWVVVIGFLLSLFFFYKLSLPVQAWVQSLL